QNGGVCIAPGICNCTEGYTGNYCQLNKPVCSTPCQNGGVCIAPGICNCTEGYTGNYCQLNKPVCSTPCQNGGVCIDPGICNCTDDYMGNYCQLNKPVCSTPCQNGGVCIAPEMCNCTEDYTGKYCQLDKFDVCDPPCENGGKCLGALGLCACPRGFGRAQCQVERCTFPRMELPNSSVGGTLSRLMIKCHSGYRMPNDATEMLLLCPRARWMTSDLKRVFTQQLVRCDPICQEECLNSGKCIAPDVCKCLPNFTGRTCQFPAN
ncbi:unnamed protein product, partial [Meganyctiphanes norvegica]